MSFKTKKEVILETFIVSYIDIMSYLKNSMDSTTCWGNQSSSDNKNIIQLSRNSLYDAKSKYIIIGHNYIRDSVEKKQSATGEVSTS